MYTSGTGAAKQKIQDTMDALEFKIKNGMQALQDAVAEGKFSEKLAVNVGRMDESDISKLKLALETIEAYEEDLSSFAVAASEASKAFQGIFKTIIDEAQSAEEAVKLGQEKSLALIYDTITNSMIDHVTNIVMEMIITPFMNGITAAATHAATIDVSGATAAANVDVTASVQAGTALATGGLIAGDALAEVAKEVVTYLDIMGQIFTNEDVKASIASFTNIIGQASGALWTATAPFRIPTKTETSNDSDGNGTDDKID
jgi:hypothetical protein